MNSHYDVVINGAGMVGTVSALLLAQQGLSVALIEAQQHTTYQPSAPRQMRVSAISRHNLELFDRLGITALMHKDRLGYYDQMKVWDNHSTGEIEFNGPSYQVLGAMIENNQIIAAAQQLAQNHNNIAVMFETSINAFEDSDRKVHIKLSNQNKLSCYLLVGADGARSKIRTDLGIATHQKPYKQHGLVCYLQLEKAPENMALQAFNSGGPVGLLPMNGGLFSMVWSLPEDQVEHWINIEEQSFINGLKAHINRDFGDIKLSSERAAFPLHKAYAKNFYQGRVALIGDAAHTIHPLAGQGVNLGFGDAECLVEKLKCNDSIQTTVKNSETLAQALKKFQRFRKAEVHKTAETMHGLHHLFTNQSAPVKMLRAFGMNRLNQFKPIKQWLLKQAGS